MLIPLLFQDPPEFLIKSYLGVMFLLRIDVGTAFCRIFSRPLRGLMWSYYALPLLKQRAILNRPAPARDSVACVARCER